MKNLFLILISLVLLTGPLFGGYIMTHQTIFTAQVMVQGITNTSMEVLLFNRIDDSSASLVDWTNIVVPISGDTTWRVANQYARIAYTNFTALWGITFSCDNKNGAIADPLFSGGDEDAGGLVSLNQTDIKLPMAWQIKDDITEPSDISDPLEDPPGSYNYRFTNVNWVWKFVVDQAQSSFTNISANSNMPAGATVNYYVTPVNNYGSLWGGAATERGGGSSPVYLYLAADFASASIQSYRTSTLTVEMFKP